VEVKKLIAPIAMSALVAAAPAWATKPPHPSHPSHPNNGQGNSCTALRNEGYYARGTLVSGTLTPGTKSGHYDGTLTVMVTRANHKAPTGSQTYTLTDVRVHFGHGVTATTLTAGDRVVLHGKITVLPKKCSSTTFTPTITIHYVTIKAPK
jgi:hypothetical protein